MRHSFLATLLLGCYLWYLPVSAGSDWDETPAAKDPPAASPADDASSSSSSSSPGKTKLQGGVQETAVVPGKGTTKTGGVLDGGPANVMPTGGYRKGEAGLDNSKTLEGKTIDDELRSMVQDGSLKPMSGLHDNTAQQPLKGNAAKQSTDPDEEDSELMVEWDRWRNRFLRAVQLGVQEMVNNPDPEDYERPRYDAQTGRLIGRYPMGTGTAFSCQITSEGRVVNLEVIEPSGFSKYDRVVLKAVKQLEGTRILNFPRASQRKTVTQAARIKTAATADFQYHKFGDVEKVRVPQQ